MIKYVAKLQQQAITALSYSVMLNNKQLWCSWLLQAFIHIIYNDPPLMIEQGTVSSVEVLSPLMQAIILWNDNLPSW